MRIINLYQETLGIVSDCCKVSKEKIISSKKEECVNARYILVSILGEYREYLVEGKRNGGQITHHNFAFENSSRLLQAYHTFNYHPFISVKAVG